MNDTVTAITCTGDRPLAFSLCQKWMANQTQPPEQWVVIDDGKIPFSMPIVSMPVPFFMDYIRREPKSNDPKITLNVNLKEAIPYITGNKILIMEDDEYYAPGYIAEMSFRLRDHEVVGINTGKYYHLPTSRYTMKKGMPHASLAQTGFRSSFLPEFVKCLDGNFYIDQRIWKKVGKRNWSGLFDDGDDMLYVGMKGLPGRAGIGYGHRDYVSFQKDFPDHKVLRRWCADAETYLALNGEGI
jgi:hypothetical protein